MKYGLVPSFLVKVVLTIVIFCLVAVALLLSPPILSQDNTPTPTETASLTEAPTLTPTPLPSDTPTEPATDLPSATPTASPSETATAEATAALTGEPTAETTAAPTEEQTTEATTLPTATATLVETPAGTDTVEAPTPSLTASATSTASASATSPALPPEPQLQLLFNDNFDTGALYLWTLGAGWSLVDSEGGKALQVTNSDEPVTFVHNTLGDVAVEAQFRFNSGMARLSVRQSDAGSYTALLDANGQVSLFRGSQPLGSATVQPNVPDQWRTLRVSALSDIVRVSVDGLEVITVQDANPLPQGTFSIAASGANALFVDDVEVQIVATPASTPTSTASPMPEVTPTLQITPRPSKPQRRSAQALAPTIIDLTTNDPATLISAIIQGNNSGTPNNSLCPANPTVINLKAGAIYTLTSVHNPFWGGNGLPVIECDITINGNGGTIQRDLTKPAFRIFAVDGDVGGTGNLTLNNITIMNGQAVATGGGGIFNNKGIVTINNSTISNNEVDISDILSYGGGIYSYQGTLTIDSSTISGNENTSFYTDGITPIGDGGGIAVNLSVINITKTSIINNKASRSGAGFSAAPIGNMLGTYTIRFSLFDNNQLTASSSATNSGGSAFYSSNAYRYGISDSCITNNTAVAVTGTIIVAQRNWWGKTTPPQVGVDIGPNVDASGFLVAQPTNCGRPAPTFNYTVADYNAYVAFDSSFNLDPTIQQNVTDTVAAGLNDVSGVLATKFYQFLPGSTYNQQGYLPDPPSFKRIMLGNDNNKIGFVFINLGTVNAANRVQVPPNVNAPEPSIDYRFYSRVCPYYINLVPTGNTPGGTLSGSNQWWVAGGTTYQAFHDSVIQAVGANKDSTHQALIVCDISQAGAFAANKFATVYNLGLMFMFENGGLGSGTTYLNFFASRNLGEETSIVMGYVTENSSVCAGTNGLPVLLAVDGNVRCRKKLPAKHTDWVRGQRGWSSPAPVLLPVPTDTYNVIRQTCGWQENPIDIIPDRTTGPNNEQYQTYEYEAASADMFLNWVYRYRGDTYGFGNYSWLGYAGSCAFTNSTTDNTYPGDTRYAFMEQTVMQGDNYKAPTPGFFR
jgi:hypothetical protein